MLGQNTDEDDISVYELISTATQPDPVKGCNSTPAPSNSPDPVTQAAYEDSSVETFTSRRNAIYQFPGLLNNSEEYNEDEPAAVSTCAPSPDPPPPSPIPPDHPEILPPSGEDNESKEGGFPYEDIATMERMVNSVGWKVPVEPGQELERLLKACLQLARAGTDEEHPECGRFYQDTLSNSFHKIMTDSAINSWSTEIQGYIFDNAVYLVKLMAVKIPTENVSLLKLMAIVFNPTSKFHHYNASQASKTVPPSSQIPGSDIFARPTDFRVPKGWLVDLINHFGSEEGFDKLLEKFKTLHSPSLDLLSTYLKPWALCIDLLTSSCVQSFLIPCTLIVTEYMKELKEEQLKKETKVETRNDTLSGMIKTLKMILQRAPTGRKSLLQGVEILHLELILKLIRSSSFNGKMNALNELNRIITPFLFNRRQLSDCDGITSEDLAAWLKNQGIVNILLTDYLHLPQYVEKLDKVLRFLIHEDKLGTCDIELIWDNHLDKHEAIVKNTHDLLAKLAWVLTPDLLDAIFARFQLCWETATHKTKEKLLELMGRLAEDDKEGVISDKVLQVLWILITGEDSSTDIIDLALSTHIKILNNIYSHDKDSQRLFWIEKCIQNIRHHHCVVASLKHLREMCKLYSASHHGYGYVHKMKQLERDNTLIQLVINDLEMYLTHVGKVVGVEERKPTEVLEGQSYSHNDELKERLEFIRFTLKHANCYLSLTHAMQLWSVLTARHIYPSDMNIIFEWFGELVGEDSDIEPSVSKQLFVDKMLSLDPLTFTEAGLSCFECYFKEVNENETQESKNTSSTSSEDAGEMFIGTDYIWRLVIEGREELIEYSISLLKDIYSNSTVAQQFVRHNEFIKTCFTKARQCFAQYESQDFSPILAKQTIRILHVLREYVCDNLDKGGEVLPSHERSWQGIPIIIIAQLLGPHDKILENIEVLTHTNESLGTIRHNLITHIYKNEIPAVPPHLQLKINNEELGPEHDKKAISQLDLKDKQFISVRVLSAHHLPSPLSSGDTSIDLFNSPCSPIKQTKYIPWLLYVSDVAMRQGQTALSDAVTTILAIFPTDMEIEQDIIELCASQAAEMKLSFTSNTQPVVPVPDTLLSTIFLDQNCGSVQYKLEIVYSLLMPSSPNAKSNKFRGDFVVAGGIEIMMLLVENPRFLADTDQATKRSCLHILAKITKFSLTVLCYATLLLFKKENPGAQSGLNLHNSLASIPNPGIERVLRVAAQQLVQDTTVLTSVRNSPKAVPHLSYIQAIMRLTWRCAFGYPLLCKPVEKDCTPSNSVLLEDMWLVQEWIENLTICFAHQPSILERLLVDEEFGEFIIHMTLMCSTHFIRQVVSEQVYLMCVKCCVDCKSILDIIKLLFDSLHKTENFGDNSCFYFGLLSRILACAAHYNIVVCNSDALLEQEVAWLKSVEHHNRFHPLNNTLLEGHLQICRELVSISPLPTKLLLGSVDHGASLLPSLLFNYLFPASKMLLDQRNCPDIELRDESPICQAPNTQEAAFNLVGALCKGCIENLSYVVKTTKEMFYSDPACTHTTTWDFAPPVQPRNLKGFVGLKNGGATCYMNAVLQQLYMIPTVRANLLSLPDPEHGTNDGRDPARLHHLGVAQQVQAMFCALKESKHQYYTPEGFWRAFKLWGEPVNLREQHDSLEFFNALLDNLVEGTKALNQPPFITDVLEGSFADQKICKDCPHRYTRIEPFLSISVDVRNHENLTDSLHEFVKGDLLEGNNAYHCERCDKKVDTVKRLCFQKLPNVLAIQLKRFGYDWERECAVKYNDYFEFPDSLSMEPYTVDFLSRLEDTVACEMIESGDREDAPTLSENSHYRLVGVVVHSGQASGGHYYSYIKQRLSEVCGEREKWYRFDDVDVTECNIDEEGQMAKLCFGGDNNDQDSPDHKSAGRAQKRWWNAYILFYERVDGPQAASPLDISHVTVEEDEVEAVRAVQRLSLSPTPILYNPPECLVRQVRQENLLFLHQRSQFCPEFTQYIKHIILPNLRSCNPVQPRDHVMEQIALDSLDLVSSYLFRTGFLCKKSIRGSIEEWQDILLNLLQSSDVCRRWFAANYLFSSPSRFYQYLVECPMADVRSSFAFVIVTLAKLAIADPPLSLSELNSWSPEGYSYSIDHVAPLSLHIISGCFAVLSDDRVDYNRNLQQFFHVFYCFAKGGLVERKQLLQLEVHTRFMRILMEENNCVRTQYSDTAPIHNVIVVLLCSIDLSCLRQQSNGLQPVSPYPAKNYQMLSKTLSAETKQLLIGENYAYIKKLMEEASTMELEDTLLLIKYVCWENARASKEILLELLYYTASVNSGDMKPYLTCLHHLLLLADSWQRKRIVLILKGGPDRETLLDLIQRSKTHHQRRAYQCMKCLTNLLTASSLASEIFFADADTKSRWESVVDWLGMQLERRTGAFHNYNTSPGRWNNNVSNDSSGNEYYLERSNSAILLHQKAEALLAGDSSEEESDTSNVTPDIVVTSDGTAAEAPTPTHSDQ